MRIAIAAGAASCMRTVRPVANASMRSQSRSCGSAVAMSSAESDRGKRNDAILARERLRNELARLGGRAGKIRDLHPEPRSERLEDRVVVHRAGLYRRVPVALGFLLLQLLEAIARDEPLERREQPFIAHRAVEPFSELRLFREAAWARRVTRDSRSTESTRNL